MQTLRGERRGEPQKERRRRKRERLMLTAICHEDGTEREEEAKLEEVPIHCYKRTSEPA